MEVQLKVLVGTNAGQILKVPGPKFFIGRAEDCQLRPGSDLVSRHHCVLMIEGSGVVLRDFGSKNGTLVNDVRIIGETPLSNGDRLKIGPLEFELQLAESLAGARRPKVSSVKEAAVRAAESSVHEDLDITALLGGGAVDTGDTCELRRGDTAELEVSGSETAIHRKPAAPPAPPPAEPVPEPVAASEPPAKQAGERKVVGKLPTVKKDGDSKDAAAEMLRRLRRR